MGSYSGNVGRPDRTKAIVGVVAVHAALAAVILTGLNVSTIRQAVEHMTTIDIVEPPEPPPPPPPPPRNDRAKEVEGAAAKQARPTEIVAPPPKLNPPSPVVAAPVAGSGAATTSGAALSGSGTGAGGSGAGTGGGGSGDTSRFTPARRLTKIPDSEYRRLSRTGILSGSVGVTILVNRDGRVSNCRVVRSSGQAEIDALMCQLTLRYLRFAPARDAFGQTVPQDVTFYPDWRRR